MTRETAKQPTPAPPPRPGRVRRVARRVVRGLLLTVAVTVLLVAALATVVATVPGARESLLRRGLDMASGAVPGRLEAADVRWPGLGRLDLYGVAWTDGADTLARVDTLSLDLALDALRHRDLRVHRVLLAGVTADIPAIGERVTAADTAAVAAPTDTTAGDSGDGKPLLRPGALPPLPSVAVQRAAIRRAAIVAAPGRIVQVDSLVVSADLGAGAEPAVSASLRGQPVPGIGVAWRLAGRVTPDSVLVDVAPLQVTRGDALPEPGSLPLSGRIAAPHALLDSLLAGAMPPLVGSVESLAIDGDAGSWTIAAGADGAGPVTLDITSSLPRAPTALLDALAAARLDTLGPGAVDTLAGRWSRAGAPGLRLHAELTPPPAPAPLSRGRATLAGRLSLPGPSALAPLLPPDLVVDDLDGLVADLDLTWDGAGEGRFAADVDLGATSWLDAARVIAHGSTSDVVVDSLALRLPGLDLTAAGRADADSVRLHLDLRVPDAALLGRWRAPVTAPDSLHLDLALDADGPWPLPQAALRVEGMLAMEAVVVPQLSLQATAAPDTLRLDLALPRGVAAGGQHVESARVRFAGATRDDFTALRGALDLRAALPRLAVDLDAYADIRGLDGRPAGDVRCDTLRLTVDDRSLASPQPWTASFDLADTSVVVSGLALGGDLGRLDLAGEVHPDSLAASVDLALGLAVDAVAGFLPPDVAAWLPRGAVTADGALDAAGATDAPWAGGRLRVGFSGDAPLAGVAADAHVSIGGRGIPPAHLDPGRAGWQQHSARVDLALSDADSLLLSVGARLPLPHPGAGADSVRVELNARQLDLARLAPLMPAGFRLEGRLQADPSAAGLMTPGEAQPDLQLGGGIALTRTRVRGPDGSWLLMDGRVELSGSSRAPVIRGGLDIDAGLIRLPEPPPSLLPAEGPALLWEAAAAADTVAAAAADTAEAPEPLPDIIPDLSFAIRCPGSLWLRGQGLDVELAGDLSLHLKNGVPGIEGELEARQGTMKQLGRVFNLRRGRIVFYVDEHELDPELDLELGVRVGAYDITITLTGTASRPELEFSSSPDLGEGDIVSVLLFGKTSAELDEGQAGLMAERTAQIAAAYGSVKLQESVAKRLGVDVVSIAPREDDSETSALTVGKYLNPRVMVRYEQVLDEESAFFVHLDYSLVASQEWKLHTQVSQGEASGVEIKWEKDW